MEGARQVVALARHRHMIFLHGLQQGGLGARAGAVDLVGHEQLREDRTAHETEGAAPALALLHDFRAQNVGRHQIRRELHAAGVKAQHHAQRIHQLGLGQARHAHQQPVAARHEGDHDLLDHLLLPEDNPADGLAGARHALQRKLGRLGDGVFQRCGV